MRWNAVWNRGLDRWNESSGVILTLIMPWHVIDHPRRATRVIAALVASVDFLPCRLVRLPSPRHTTAYYHQPCLTCRSQTQTYHRCRPCRRQTMSLSPWLLMNSLGLQNTSRKHLRWRNDVPHHRHELLHHRMTMYWQIILISQWVSIA